MEKGKSAKDAYKETTQNVLQILQNRKPVINEKLKRCRQFKTNLTNKPPPAYTENSPKQELVLEHVIQFKKQFQNHTDENRELFIYPKNECDVYKFICTTIRPTKLGFLQLYDYKVCAQYISKFIQYEELDPPDDFPKCIPSPANVARWQKGDCFDMSILLTSLLIGVGYNAYCVYGVAPKEITTKNEALMQYQDINRGIIDEDEQDKELEVVTQEFNKIPRKKKIASQFDAEREEKQRREKEELARKALTIDDDEPDQLAPDLYLGRRIHCWVLLIKGKRGITEDLFIEPSTGRIYPTRKSPYLLVDAIFNHTNFFIHMQPKHRVQDIKFEMYETMAWEYVMLRDEIFRNEDDPHDDDHGNVGKVDPQDQKLKDFTQTLDMPPPWSPKIYIDKDAFMKGTPLGQSTVFYIKMKLENYADYSQPDGLVQKFTIYEDFKKLKIKQIRYFYKHRTDKLEVRRRFPFLFKTVEQYGPKLPYCWKQVITVDKRIRIIKFYPNRNEDGLIKRVEKIGQKTVQYYQNRSDDLVISRSIRFKKVNSQQKKNNTTKDYYYDDNHLNKQVWVYKMTQKYERNPKLPAGEQIAKLVIDVEKNKVVAYFHMQEGEISPVMKQYSRDQILGIAKTDSNEKKIDDPVTQQENQKILAIEKDCYTYMRTQETDFAKQVKQMHLPVSLEKTLHDKARDKFKQNLNKEEDRPEEEDLNDYLRPFLEKEKLPINAVLDYEKAVKIKDQVMKKLKDRIIARAKIIQSRLQAQQEILRQQEQIYQKRQQDKNTDNKELADIKFKIGILESRSGRFQSLALQKFHQMDTLISNDPRMAALKTKDKK